MVSDPLITAIAGATLIMNVGGPPTDDKPTVTLETPPDLDRTSALLNLRVGDIDRAHREWSARGRSSPPLPSTADRRSGAYIRDPDGHLLGVGQSTGG